MKLRHFIYTMAMGLLPFIMSAQEFSYGFKVGLNFANMPGDLEQDDAGENIERLKTNTGFHVGASIRYSFNDRFGIKGDFLFSQKGTQQFYDGQGAQLFHVQGTNDFVGITGTQERFLRITNSYIEIPISAYGKFGKVEVFGGPYIGFLVSSKAIGDYKFDSPFIEFSSNLDYNYLKDDLIDATTIELNSVDYNSESYFGNTIFYPEAGNAYDDFSSKDGNAFKGIDFGLNAGLAYFLNRGLYVSANVNYGLIDLTNKAYDHSYGSLKEDDPNQYVERDDVDKNFAIQVSVGFAF